MAKPKSDFSITLGINSQVQMFRGWVICGIFLFQACLFSQHTKGKPSTIKSSEWKKIQEETHGVVSSVKKIDIPHYLGAFNPSILKVDDCYLLSFRYLQDSKRLWISEIGLLLLDKNFSPISEVQFLNTRVRGAKTPSQAEDARLFSFNGGIYLIYNDSVDIISPKIEQHRDMFMAEVIKTAQGYTLGSPLKLTHAKKYQTVKWQKNWVPFTYKGKLLITYSINPHEIVDPNLMDGVCKSLYETNHPNFPWKWGPARGSTPPLLIDGEYVAFFHSGVELTSPVSVEQKRWHYFMGAYTFSKDPPFKLTKISPQPILGRGLYHHSSAQKRVIFPGGSVVEGSKIHVACGKDDHEILIVTIDKERLFETLQPLN